MDWDPRYLYVKFFGDDMAAMEFFLTHICTPEWHAQMDAGRPIALCCQELAAEHPDYAELVYAWGQRAEEMIRGVFEGSVDVLAELKTAGVRCFALSNMEKENYQHRLEIYPFMKWFDGVFISGYEEVMKPDPRYYRRALERLNLQAESVVFIDDRAVNVEAAAQLGIPVVWFRSPSVLRERLVARGLLAALAPGRP